MAINIPKHVAIIPDGNRRWSKEKGLKETAGHFMAGSYENMKNLFQSAQKLGVKYVSIWGFSTENWKRNAVERNAIFEIIEKGVRKFIDKADEEKVRFICVGRRDRMPKVLVEKIEELEKKTRKYEGFSAVFCLDYGGRDEIVRAVNKAVEDGKKVDEDSFMNLLDTNGIPEPELVIRTGGEMRLSGFMPFQTVYAELYFTDKYFPDFGPKELKKAIENFSDRERRFGK